MARKTLSGMMLTLLLMSALVFAFYIQPVSASAAVYIRADGSIDPPTALIQRNGDFYVLTGNIFTGSGGIVIERGDMTLDGAGYTVQGMGSGVGIDLSEISGVTIKNIQVKSFSFGMRLHHSSNNSLVGNIIMNNGDGVDITESQNNRLIGNTIADNSLGAWIYKSLNHSIVGNNITSNWIGVRLEKSSNNTLSENNITAHNDHGIFLSESSNNRIIRNNLERNVYASIWLQWSSNNVIYHNNLKENIIQVYYTPGYVNSWDNGYEGNYWSDYTGNDTSTPPDGIGDTKLPWQGVDPYPLMNPYWDWADINHDLKVDIDDVVLAAIAFGSYKSHPRWNPHVDINDDNIIDLDDIVAIAINTGKAYP